MGGSIRTFPDVLAVLTQTAAHQREVGGPKTSKLCRPQFSPPLSLAVSVGVSLRSCALSAVSRLDCAIGQKFAAHLDAPRQQPFSACASFFSAGAVIGHDGMRVAHDTAAIGRSPGECRRSSPSPIRNLVAKVTGLCKPRRRREESGSDRQTVAHSWVSNSFLRAPFFSSGFVQMVEAGGVASWRCQREK